MADRSLNRRNKVIDPSGPGNIWMNQAQVDQINQTPEPDPYSPGNIWGKPGQRLEGKPVARPSGVIARPGGVIARPGGGQPVLPPQPPALFESTYGDGELVDAETLKREKELAMLRREREKDLELGRARGEEIFGEGSLGRVETATTPEMQDIIDRRKAMLSGYTPQEIEAQRSIYLTPAQQALSGQVRAMRGAQANAGVRGATASSQEGQIRSEFAQKQAQLSQAQALADTEARRQALTGYQAAIQGSEANRLNREQYNIGQQNRELLGRLNTELGYGSLGVADRGYLSQQEVADQFNTYVGLPGNPYSEPQTQYINQDGTESGGQLDWMKNFLSDAASGGDRIAGQIGGFAGDGAGYLGQGANWLGGAAGDSASWLGGAAGSAGGYLGEGAGYLNDGVNYITGALPW